MMKILYKLYSFLIALPLFLVVTIIVAICVTIAAFCGDSVYIGYYLPKWWSRFTLWVFLIPVKTDFDIFLIYGYLGHNFKWMMKEYLRKIPFVGLACAKSGHIYVGDSRASMQKTVVQAQETLREGMSMVIFPEGTHTHDGKMGGFKKGAFTLANEIGLPIVPLTINGSFDIFSRNAYSVTRHPISLTVHRPITAEDREGKPTRILMQEVFDVIHSDLEEKYK